jgi:hypothetical protein
MRVAVLPLHVDSPVSEAVVEGDHVVLAGKTGRGAHLSAAGRPVAVGADGTFSTTVPVTPGNNSIALRSSGTGQAPRFVNLAVKRVEHLADEAKAFAASAPLAFSDLAADVSKHLGARAVVAGEVVEARAQGARSLLLLDVQKGCPHAPCLARVVIAGEDPPKRGDHLQVFGHVSRAINPKGDSAGSVPEIEASFVLKKP